MEKNETDLSPRQSFQLIENMINKAKDRFNENGHLYLLWGWTVLLCSLAQFVLIHFVESSKHYYVWFFSWIIVIYQVVYVYKRRRSAKVRTYTDELIGYVWITFGVLLFLIGFFFGRILGGNYYQYVFPLVLALYGMPAFLSGAILRFKPLMLGGIGCWLLSLIACFAFYDYQLLFIAAAVVIAWIIPGYMLRNKFEKLQKQERINV